MGQVARPAVCQGDLPAISVVVYVKQDCVASPAVQWLGRAGAAVMTSEAGVAALEGMLATGTICVLSTCLSAAGSGGRTDQVQADMRPRMIVDSFIMPVSLMN